MSVAYKLTYVATIQQLVANELVGDVFTFQGSQIIVSNNPQSSDFSTACTAMGTDIAAQLTTGFPLQQSQDSASDSSGGSG